MSSPIPGILRRNAEQVWGDAGRTWLAGLPDQLAALAEGWELRLGTPYDLSYHWVCRAVRRDGTPAVLKVGPAGAGHLGREATTLRAWSGRGAVRLLEYDAAAGALLLERAEPGTMARRLVPEQDEVATAAAISVLRRLHIPADGVDLPPVNRYAEDFAAYLERHPDHGPLPREYVVRAAGLLSELTSSATESVVLHGDLHHDNVLAAERESWLCIDPHGLVGDPAYDVGAWLYNPDPARRDDRLATLVPRRCEQLADGLGQPLDRVHAYGFVVAVLSEVWTVEDGGDPDGRPLDVARSLAPRLP